jgi:hypothetical protein
MVSRMLSREAWYPVRNTARVESTSRPTVRKAARGMQLAATRTACRMPRTLHHDVRCAGDVARCMLQRPGRTSVREGYYYSANVHATNSTTATCLPVCEDRAVEALERLVEHFGAEVGEDLRLLRVRPVAVVECEAVLLRRHHIVSDGCFASDRSKGRPRKGPLRPIPSGVGIDLALGADGRGRAAGGRAGGILWTGRVGGGGGGLFGLAQAVVVSTWLVALLNTVTDCFSNATHSVAPCALSLSGGRSSIVHAAFVTGS